MLGIGFKFMNRIAVLDIAKGVGMIFVVLGHSNLPKFATYFIYAFHMPLFFFLSGVLYFKAGVKGFCYFFINKVRTLLIPYWVFSLFALLVYFYSHQLQSDAIRLFFSGDGVDKNLAVWFLAHLFLLQILMYFMRVILFDLTWRGVVVVSIVFLVFGLLSSFYQCHFIYHAEILGFSAMFYLWGAFFGKNLEKFTLNKNKVFLHFFSSVSSAIALFFVVNYTIVMYPSHVDLNSNFIGDPVLFFLGSFLGIYFVLHVSKIFLSNQLVSSFLQYVGRNSLVILCVHQFVPVGLKYFYADFGFNFDPVVHKVLVLMVIWMLIFIFNKYLWFVIRVKN